MIIKVGKEEVELSEEHVKFAMSDAGINEYLAKFGGWYSYLNKKLMEADFIKSTLEDEFDKLYSYKLAHYKESAGGSDKFAEAKARSDVEVCAIRERFRAAKLVADQLKGHLRSMDKAHENVLNVCYNMRKEIDKLGSSYVADLGKRAEEYYSR